MTSEATRLSAEAARSHHFALHKTVIDCFREQVARTPDATAVIGLESTLTYRELDRRSSALAAYLRHECGVEPEELVGVVAGRSERTVIGLLGVMMAGACYTPLDLGYPRERIDFIVGDTACRVMVEAAEAAPEWLDVRRVPLDAATAAPLPPAPLPRGLAYVNYTSGSTGRPKGVLIEHRGLLNVCLDHVALFGVTPQDRVLHFSTPAFDAAMFQVFVPLISGAAVVTVDRATIDDPPRLLGHIDETRSTILSFPPAYLHLLGPARFPFARVINTGGDAPLVSDALFHARHLRFLATYGPTETSICAAYCEVDPAMTYEHGVPLGVPVSNMRLHVLDDALNRVPEGERGEICISGPGVARGYLNRPDLTAARFVADPFVPGERMYRTGDLGRILADGSLVFEGRRDRQVKIRGFRVEPGEIEAALELHPEIERAVVLVSGSGANEKQLVAYLFGASQPRLDAVRAFVAAMLPDYLVPARMTWAPAPPLTSHGKIDVARLSALASGADAAIAPQGVAPRNEREEVIVAAWREVLGVSSIGIHDDFFLLGGHSLAAVRIAYRLRAAGLDVSAADLFTARTAARLTEVASADRPTVEENITPLPKADHYPASRAQVRLWMHAQLEPDSAAYNIAVAHDLTGALDETALAAAIGDVVGRHETLRTHFVVRDGIPRQIVDGSASVPLVCVDAAPEDADALAAEESERPFDLAKDAPLRMTLLRLGGQHFRLLTTIHHAVADGWSLGRFLAEVSIAYRARLRNSAPDLPLLRLQYRDFAAYEQSMIDSPRGRERAAQWRALLAHPIPRLELPTDRPQPVMRSTRGATLSSMLGPELVAALRRLGQEQGVSLFMIFVAAVKIVLHRYTGATDIIVGAPFAHRPAVELDEQIGFFVETVPLRDRLDDALTVRGLLQRVKRTCIEALGRLFPFDLIAAGHEVPLFDVMVALQQRDELALALDGVEIVRARPRFAGSKFALSFDFVEGDGDVELRSEFSVELFDAARIERTMTHIARTLEGMAADPLQTLGAIDILGAGERARVVSHFNDTKCEIPPDRSLLDLFNATVASDPDRPALVCGGRTSTYADVDRASTALMAELLGDDSFVAIVLPRREAAFVAMLATWKAGRAFVPLDPASPPERLLHLVRDSGTGAVICDATTRSLAEWPVRTVDVDTTAAGAHLVPHSAVGSSPAYCIYTSGSTGAPKGVVVSHSSLLHAAHAWREMYALERPRILQLASFAFDVAIGDLCRSLLAGGVAVIARDDERLDPALILDLLERHGITMFETTPAVARLLTEAMASRPAPRCPSLELLAVGSDVWLAADHRRLRALLSPHTRLVNSYGTTETSIDSAYYDDTRDGPMRDADPLAPIGRPMQNVEMFVCDDRLAPSPIGVPGELCIGGPGLALGYLNAPELTAGKFVPHPFRPNDRLYRTGDRAVWRDDGVLTLAGRFDHQVKVRGYRIEPAEIESALLALPRVRAAAVIVEAGQLVACIDGGAIDERALSDAVAAALPPYMVPSRFLRVEAMPLSPNGKIDRAALHRIVAEAARHDETPREPPKTATERAVAELWHELLDGARPGRESSFFALGGDSIRAVQFALRCRARGWSLRVSDIYGNPTLAAVAAHLDRQVPAHLEPIPLHLLDRAPHVASAEDVYPASRMQRLMLRASGSVRGLYHGHTRWQIADARLDLAVWERALRHVIDRSPAMRTGFVRTENGEVWQAVLPPESVGVTVEDVSCLDGAAQEARIDAFAAEDRNSSFAIAAVPEPFCRLRLFVRSPRTVELFLSIHHALDDGWASMQLENTILDTVRALHGGTELPPRGENVLKELAALEREIEQSPEAAAFWLRELDGADGAFPPRAGVPSIATLSVALDAAGARALPAEAARRGVTLKALSLARFAGVAGSLNASREPVIGVVTNGRTERLSDPLGAMGLFWNLVPLRVRAWPEDEQPRRLEQALRLIEPFARYPITRVVDADVAAPWPPLCFNFVHLHGIAADRDDGLRVLRRHVIDEFHYPFTCATVVAGDGSGIDVRVQYDRRYFSEETARAAILDYTESLRRSS